MKASTIRTLAVQLAPSRGEPAAELDQRLAADPRCPVARYLAGCQCLDRNRPATAVRHMMIAHHAEPAFESAALLVFAGLNWIARRQSDLLTVLLDTWLEFRRPEFDRTRAERTLLDVFDQPCPVREQVSPLARRLWRLPIPMLRTQIKAALASTDAGRFPLLVAPA